MRIDGGKNTDFDETDLLHDKQIYKKTTAVVVWV